MEGAIQQTHYPITESADEWAREIGALDRLLNEGFEQKELKRRATKLGRTIDQAWRSLKLLEETLLGLGHDDGEARSIVAPFRELADLRTKASAAHAAGEEGKAKRAGVLKEHGSFHAHYRSLSRRCYEGLVRLRKELA
jgi:hypothetical protein